MIRPLSVAPDAEFSKAFGLRRPRLNDPLLRVENLTACLSTPSGDRPVLDDVSFSLERGRILCLVGESGCGKSVTARAILRLLDWPLHISPSSRVLFDGQDLGSLPERGMRQVRGRDIAMIFQDPMSSLNPVKRVGEQVAETLILHRRVSHREARDRTIALFRQVGIPVPERRVRQFPHELSGGMQQRAMIAMALACDPKVLIADEPTTALDATIQAQILDLLRELRETRDMAILLITHDLGVVAEMADNIAVMYAGRIVEYGPVEQVLTSPQHPYTEQLLRSVPRLLMPRDQRLAVIGGSVPSALDRPPGCAFAPRCTYAFERCIADRSPPLPDTTSHAASCWLCHDGPRATRGVWEAA
jgi:peptide/nickel transport system ATP-binding protein/oligopeptide transport system ATP-binding protein